MRCLSWGYVFAKRKPLQFAPIAIMANTIGIGSHQRSIRNKIAVNRQAQSDENLSAHFA